MYSVGEGEGLFQPTLLLNVPLLTDITVSVLSEDVSAIGEVIYVFMVNPSAWEYQSATLDCIYHKARQSSSAGDDILDITGW